VHRTTFARQAASLWRVKQLLQARLADWLAGDDPAWLVDSLPVEACRFARATFCRRFGGQADCGYDHGVKRTFYGSRLRLRTSRVGLTVQAPVPPLSFDRLLAARKLAHGVVQGLTPLRGHQQERH
jgi:hypothetical protein